MKEKRLQVITFNTWMLRLPFGLSIAQDIDERAKLIPKALANTGADIFLLQEVWDTTIRARWIEEFKELGYGYSAYSPEPKASHGSSALALLGATVLSGFWHSSSDVTLAGGVGAATLLTAQVAMTQVRKRMGDGLLIVSRLPLEIGVEPLRFHHYTRPDEVFVAKGAMHAKAYWEGFGWIDLYNSHLGAVSFSSEEGNFNSEESYRRYLQTKELTEWIDGTQGGRASIIGLDLNVHYLKFKNGEYNNTLSEEYRLFLNRRFTDAFHSVNGYSKPRAFTDNRENRYKLSGYFHHTPEAFLDYIFVGQRSALKPVRAEIILRDPHLPLSDHFGVLTEFQPKKGSIDYWYQKVP